MNADQKKMLEIALKYFGMQFSALAPNTKDAITAAIEYGRSTATAQTTARPVMTTAEPGKKYPITEAHVAAMEFEEALDESVMWYRVHKPENASGSAQVALSDMLNDLLNQTLAIRGQLARLAKAEK